MANTSDWIHSVFTPMLYTLILHTTVDYTRIWSGQMNSSFEVVSISRDYYSAIPFSGK